MNMKTMISMSTATVLRIALVLGAAGALAATAGCAADSSEPDPPPEAVVPNAPIVEDRAPGSASDRAAEEATAVHGHVAALLESDQALTAAAPVDVNGSTDLGGPATSLPVQTTQQTEECVLACAICYSTGKAGPCGVCHSLACRK
jgi:hypothetical protein